MMAELCHRTDNLVEIVRSRRASYAKVLCCGCASMAAMYAIAKVFKSWRGIVKEHGALEPRRSEEHTSVQSHHDLVCRLLLEKKKKK